MAIYIVTYDLRKGATPEDYQKLIDLIKEDGSWACLGTSSYLIESECSARELRDKFKKVLDDNDMLYVGAVSAPAAWHGYSSEVSQWILKKLNK